jgi:Family of unknown function (DUF5675)
VVTLERTIINECGAFGTLSNAASPQLLLSTLEHSYVEGDEWKAKLPAGIYTCKRGVHQLIHNKIETFQIMEVPGHSGMLFHLGNTEEDSEGCVLLGMWADSKQLYHSAIAFSKFMASLQGKDQFTLEVK